MRNSSSSTIMKETRKGELCSSSKKIQPVLNCWFSNKRNPFLYKSYCGIKIASKSHNHKIISTFITKINPLTKLSKSVMNCQKKLEKNLFRASYKPFKSRNPNFRQNKSQQVNWNELLKQIVSNYIVYSIFMFHLLYILKT